MIGDFCAVMFTTLCTTAGLKAFQLKLNQERLLKEEINLSWVQKLSWRDFEKQTALAYRRQGYEVKETGSDGPDGGIDLVLKKNGKITVVQCKHWKSWHVGVSPVRELLGAKTAEKADAAIFIASGDYTEPAQRFAKQNDITLISHTEFIELIRQFQRDQLPQVSAPSCPLCQSPMLLKTAKKGASAGNNFWGCSTWPNCKGSRTVSA